MNLDDLIKRLERIAFHLEGKARSYRAEAAAAASVGADKRVYLKVADDNLARARTIREAVNALSGGVITTASGNSCQSGTSSKSTSSEQK